MKMSSGLAVLEEFRKTQEMFDPGLFVAALAASLVAAFAASALYRLFYEHRGTGSHVHRAFPLLGISITALFVAIQVSIPLSLGLLGALSIIRFRTPIKEPEEVWFIMLVIAGSVCAATFHFDFLFLLYVVAVAALFLARWARARGRLGGDGVMVLSVPDGMAPALAGLLAGAFAGRVRSWSIESSSSRDGLTRVQMVFSGLKSDVTALQSAVRDGIQPVSVDVFLDRPGGLG